MFGRNASPKTRGQGSLEYLLLIGGAVLVASVVIGLIVSSSRDTGSTIKTTTVANAACSGKTVYGTCVVAPGCIALNKDGVEISSASFANTFSRCVSGTSSGGGTSPSCTPSPEAGHCSDGLDNDCDGLTDSADTVDCGGAPPSCSGSQTCLCSNYSGYVASGTFTTSTCIAGVYVCPATPPTGACTPSGGSPTCNPSIPLVSCNPTPYVQDYCGDRWSCSDGSTQCRQRSIATPESSTFGNCSDGSDNDCDGLTDSADPNCGGGGGNPSGS